MGTPDLDLSRDVRITILAFGVMCLAAGVNLFFFQGKRPQRFATVAPVERVAANAGADRGAAIATPEGKAATLINAAEPAVERTAVVAQKTAVAGPPMDPAEIVRGIQKGLTARGYEPGQSDGVPGLVTRAAIMAYEYDSGLVMTGEPSREVMQHLLIGASGEPVKRSGPPEVRGTQAIAIVKWVARQLTGLGFAAGPGDGGMGNDLIKAISDYETAQKLPVTGRISAPLVARLAKPPAPAKVSAR